MTEITTIAELKALPILTVLVDCDNDAWQKRAGGSWSMVVGGDMLFSASELMSFAPLVLPDPIALRMTRCSGSDSCPTTTPLPDGASWYCREHAGTATTTKEN